jgi:mono/diheme cytochrome c family protein
VTAKREALPECFGCHVTGHGDPAGYDPAVDAGKDLVNVQCEVCHGKGTAHARDGTWGKSLLMQSCAQCHDPENSPDFDPHVYWLMIEH